jgi:hypothetical protein
MCVAAFSEMSTVFDGVGRRGFVALRSRSAGGTSDTALQSGCQCLIATEREREKRTQTSSCFFEK